MIVWIAFLVLLLSIAMTALLASHSARTLAKFGCVTRAEVACTLSYCLFVVLAVIFICTVSSRLDLFGLVLTAALGLMAWREWRFAKVLPTC